jgi:hypothetical protein
MHVTLQIIHENRNGSLGRDVFQAFGVQSITKDVRIQFNVTRCGICGWPSGTGAGFSSSTSVFACQYHSTSAACSRRYLLPMPFKIKNKNNVASKRQVYGSHS